MRLFDNNRIEKAASGVFIFILTGTFKQILSLSITALIVSVLAFPFLWAVFLACKGLIHSYIAE